MTGLPPAVRAAADRALEERGAGPVSSVTSVSGGCINHGVRVADAAGDAWFLKWNPDAPPGLFEAEADGLDALRAAGALRVPSPVAHGRAQGTGWLVMEYVAAGAPSPGYDQALGRGLAALHAHGRDGGGAPGWPSDNWIGSLPQANEPLAPWSTFWRDRRIVPQLERARRRGHLTDAGVMDRLVDVIPRALAPVDADPPSLLHGDLWSGNVYPDASGAPVLVDPAVYRGHAEVDRAMTELFGGFGPGVYAAYDAVEPLPAAYHAVRRPLYQLYYLLVHVNLFGAGYERGARAAARSVVEAVS